VHAGLRRRLAVGLVTALGCGALAGSAGASAKFQLSISPARVAPGGTVTISTTPRLSCTLTVTIAKKPFSHPMAHGWTQVRLARKDAPGRVPVKVVCSGQVATGSYLIER
jgi:hypothetical protein